VRHDFKFKFIGAARDVLRHGTLRNPDRPDQILYQAAADKIRNYREPYARTAGQSVAGVSASWRIHSAFLRLLYYFLRTGKRLITSRPSAMSRIRRSTASPAASTSPSKDQRLPTAPASLHHRPGMRSLPLRLLRTCDPWCPPRRAPSCCCASCLATTCCS